MFERVIYSIVKAGVDYFVANPARLRTFFSFQRGLTDAEAEKLVQNFIESPPRVQHGFPVADTTFPTYCILLEEETPFQEFLGNAGASYGSLEDAEDGVGYRARDVQTYATLVRGIYTIQTASANSPDVCIFLHELLKFIVTRARKTWLSAGVGSFKWSAGSMRPTNAYSPHYVFERSLTLELEAEYSVPIDQDADLVTYVTGLHVNSGEPLGVAANVTPIDPTD